MRDDFEMRPRSVAIRMMPSAAVVLASPVVSWWLIGDVSEESEGSLDYYITPFELSDSAVESVGLVALGIAGLGVVLGFWLFEKSLLSGREIVATVPLLAVGVFFGLALRVFTAGVSGANLGVGLMIMVGLVFVPTMLVLVFLILRGGHHLAPPRAEDSR